MQSAIIRSLTVFPDPVPEMANKMIHHQTFYEQYSLKTLTCLYNDIKFIINRSVGIALYRKEIFNSLVCG